MNISSKVLQQISKTASKTIPVVGEANLFGQIAKKTLSKISLETLGYDFIGLGQKILVFYGVAFLIIKYFEAVIFGSGIVKTLGGLAGINLNPALPDSIVKFFKDGIQVQQTSLKPWDVVNLIAFFLLIAEAVNYYKTARESGKSVSVWTTGIWGLIIGSFILLVLIPLFQKLKGGQHMTAADFAAKYNVPVTSTFAITILNPTNNQTQDFIMTAAQVVSLPSTFYVTKGPVVSSLANNISDSMFQQLFGVQVAH